MQLNWQTGGWFGSQLGGTAWILVASLITFGHDISTGLILLLLFLIPNSIGTLLWHQRKISCYASIQILFACCGLFGLLAVFVLDKNNLWLAIQQGGTISATKTYVLLCCTVLILMVYFHVKFGQKPNKPST